MHRTLVFDSHILKREEGTKVIISTSWAFSSFSGELI